MLPRLLFFIILGFASTTPAWRTDFEKSKIDAVNQHKYILLSFSGSDWCIPCMKLDEKIFSTAAFNDFAEENLILVKADFPRNKKNKLDPAQSAKNDKLAEKYNPDGVFPLTLILNPAGKSLLRLEGLPKGSAEDFIVRLQEVIPQKVN